MVKISSHCKVDLLKKNMRPAVYRMAVVKVCNVKYLYCSSQHGEMIFSFGYIVVVAGTGADPERVV